MEDIFQTIQDNNYYKYLTSDGWVYSSSNQFLEVNSPIDESIVGSLSAISVEEVNEAISKVTPLQLSWAQMPLNKRVEIMIKASVLLKRNVDYLTNLIHKEVGKSIEDSKDEVNRTADLIEYYAQQALRISEQTQFGDSYPNYKSKKIAINARVPYGIVLAIPPFNYPLNESAPKIVSALVMGNACIVKVPTHGGITNLHLAQIFVEAGVPCGVLTVLSGSGSVIGDEIVKNDAIDVINFTGSYETAKHIALVAGIKKLILGLSGKDSAIVCADSDLNHAVRECVVGSLSYSGQRCTAIKKIFVEENIYDNFLDLFLAQVTTNDYGPVIDIKTANYIEQLKEDAISKGAKIIYGERINNLEFKPYILTDVTDDMRISWEEPFGPILPIMKFSSIDDAVDKTNRSEYGLQASIFTKDINKAFDVASRLNVGTVQINGKDSRSPDHFPFSGAKKSGLGNVQGAKYLLEEVTRIKSIVVNL